MKIICFFLLCFPAVLLGQSSDYLNQNLTPKDPADIKVRELQEHPNIYLFDESLDKNKNPHTNLPGEYHYSALDSYIVSVSALFNENYEKISALTSFELTILKRSTSYANYWWGVQLRRTLGNYSQMADELSSSGSLDTNADSNVTRGDSQQVLTSLGLGAGYRFNFLSEVGLSNHFYEHVIAYASYVTHQDKATGSQYQGVGFNADYGVFYRPAKSAFMGLKMSYNINSLSRTATLQEKKTDRSLVLGHVAMGVELGYYF